MRLALQRRLSVVCLLLGLAIAPAQRETAYSARSPRRPLVSRWSITWPTRAATSTAWQSSSGAGSRPARLGQENDRPAEGTQRARRLGDCYYQYRPCAKPSDVGASGQLHKFLRRAPRERSSDRNRRSLTGRHAHTCRTQGRLCRACPGGGSKHFGTISRLQNKSSERHVPGGMARRQSGERRRHVAGPQTVDPQTHERDSHDPGAASPDWGRAGAVRGRRAEPLFRLVHRGRARS